MAYSRTTWVNGDLITAEKLNNLESGILGNESEIAETNGDLAELSDVISDTMDVTLTGSYVDFSAFFGKNLFGTGCMFSGSGATYDIDISGLDLAGKTLSTFLWLDSGQAFIDGNITETQLDENNSQIYPASGYHYIGHPMEILSGCKKIRLFASPNAYSNYGSSVIQHIQLTQNGLNQVDYTKTYSVKNVATEEALDDVKTSVSFEYVVKSNNQIDTNAIIGKTFGAVNDTIYKFPFGKTLADIDNGHTNFIVHLNTGSISGYYQLVKEDGTTDNGNYVFNTSTIGIVALTNPDRIRGVKIHAYSAGESTVISSLGLTFNGATMDTFSIGQKSNVNPPSWQGKKWIAYGDSITQGGLWEPYVCDRLGLILTNAGLGSSCVADVDGATVASFTNSDRISALPTDADVVTIMGGTNDYGNNVPIGDTPTSTPFDKTKFKGALCETINLIQTRCPNALIIVMSNIGGRGTTGVSGTIPPNNTLGLHSSDYAKAAEEIADFMGVPFIDVHRCGINPINRTLYISDSVHPNQAGAELIARKVIAYLVNNYPN